MGSEPPAEPLPRISRIVSGGQTGADRAALDAALAAGIPHGGWIPAGRWAEDGPIPLHYAGLQEAASPSPDVRTALNVRDADATLIVSHGPLHGGTLLTRRCALECAQPLLHLDLAAVSLATARARLAEWLRSGQPAVLNVAGPRASEDAEIYAATRALLAGLGAPPRFDPH